MKNIRRVLFWLHFTCGTVAGLFIAVMCATGTMLAYEKAVTDHLSREATHFSPPTGSAALLTMREILRRAREENDDAPPSAVTVSSDPSVAVQVDFGRETTDFVNPFTGDIRVAPTGVRRFFQSVEDWHRTLALGGDRRPIGRAITGVANAAFFVLALTGIYLWTPRRWSWDAFRSAARFRFRLAGRARDFNWHTTVGIWSSPILVVLTLTALPMSYRWANDTLFRLAGSPPPSAPTADAPKAVTPPAPEARPLDPDALIAAARQLEPDWETISLRLRAGRRPEGANSGAPREEGRRNEGARGENRRNASATTVVVRTKKRWPLFSSITLTLNPYTGEVMQRSDFATAETGRRWRTWARFLHTGEAFGLVGQSLAAAGTLGGLVLVVTGFILAFRRLFGRSVRPAETA